MNMLSFLPWRKKLPPCSGRRPPPTERPADEEDDRPLGCGWFDSSHDLQSGLLVHEHASADGLGRELPPACWH